MGEKQIKVNFKVSYCGNVKEITYDCGEDTLVKNVLGHIYKIISNAVLDLRVDGDNISGVYFIKSGIKQKARANYKLLEFLNNFEYDLNNVEICWLGGIGGGFVLEDGIMIRINADEPHTEPHVHVYPGRYSKSFVRISLTTFTQMKGDKEKFSKIFNRKDRKTIEEILKDRLNNSRFIEYYSRAIKGEYISEEYFIEYEGHKYKLNKVNVI